MFGGRGRKMGNESEEKGWQKKQIDLAYSSQVRPWTASSSSVVIR